MNVTQSEKRPLKSFTKTKNELIRKDVTIGIRGSLLLPVNPYKTINNVRKSNKKAEPRYKFEQQFSTSKRPMGPPSGPPPNLKRRINYTSSSTKPESSSSCQTQPRILASDSAAADTDFSTPKSRPSALRYISSSSRGGHSGTRSARSTSTSVVDASVILAISEGRGMARGEIGMAAVDLRHPHLVLCQFSDTLLYTHTLTKINYFNPIEIVVPHTFCEGVQPNQLYKLIKDQFPLVNVTAVQRRHFNDAAGRQNIQTLCAPQYNTVYLQVIHKFYSLTAAAAVLKYVEYIQCIVFARESLKIEYHSSENTMIIDVGTATQLELVQPLVPSAGPTCCLLGVLGPTYTVGGIRALRAAILQPSCNKEFIEARLDAVQELIENDTGLMVDIQDVIKKLSEIDKILFLCIETTNQNIDKYGEAQLNQTLLLKTTMEMVPKLVEALQPVISDRLRNIKLDFENPHYKKITDCIRTVIQEDAHLEKGAMGSMQRCFAVKPEINGLLDVARRTYSELIEDIQKIVEQLGETYDLPLRLNQNVMKGFHIVLPVAPRNRRHFNIEELPSIFIQVIFNGASVTMTTEELVVLDQQAKESLKEIQKMSNIVICTLLKELRPFMSSLYKLCENVAELDILLALAQTSTVGSYIRPDFDSYLDIRNSVHPLLDYNTHVMPVPNDIFASPEHNFTIITGPNMGGKSIYIKQIAIMHIMAQLGCFIPATNAVLRLCDRIFSRIGFNDSIEFNASFFVIEMKEAQHILKGLTSSSLVIMDELCRLVEFGNSFNEESIQSYILLIQSNFSGTNIEEGASLAWSICEELIMSEAFTFFTTHFMHLSRLQDLYYNVINVHTAVKEEIDTSLISEKRLIYQHKIEPGITTIKNYGLTLAAMTNLPADVVSLAKELAELMDRSTEPYEIPSLEQTDEAVLYDLNAKIQQASRKNHKCEESLKNILKQFKNHYPQIMDRLKLERSINSNKDTTNTTIDQIHNSSIETTVSQELQKNKNNHSPKQSSTSIDSDSEMECLESNENIIASVKSSTQLLNIFINNTTNINPTTQKDIQDVTNNITEYKDEANGQNNNLILVKADIRHNNNFVKFNDIGKIANNTIRDDDENIINVISNVDSSNDSDIAEDLTQVLEDCSEDDSGNSSKMSLDEGLMKETLDEINRDLNTMLNESIEDIVLTPPLEFRDSTNVYDNIIQK